MTKYNPDTTIMKRPNDPSRKSFSLSMVEFLELAQRQKRRVTVYNQENELVAVLTRLQILKEAVIETRVCLFPRYEGGKRYAIYVVDYSEIK